MFHTLKILNSMKHVMNLLSHKREILKKKCKKIQRFSWLTTYKPLTPLPKNDHFFLKMFRIEKKRFLVNIFDFQLFQKKLKIIYFLKSFKRLFFPLQNEKKFIECS